MDFACDLNYFFYFSAPEKVDEEKIETEATTPTTSETDVKNGNFRKYYIKLIHFETDLD